MPACVPVRDLKNTAEFTALVEYERDVTVTKNGYTAFHCLSEEQYQLMQQEAAKARLLSRIMLAEKEIASEAWSDYDDFAHELRDEHGL